MRRRNSSPCPFERLVHRRIGLLQVDDGARHRRVHLVEERAESGVAAVEVAELVREHRLRLRHGQDLQQRQADAEDAFAAEAEPAVALRDEGVDLGHQEHVLGQRLVRFAGDLLDHPPQARRLLPGQRHARIVHARAPREHAPQHHTDGDGREQPQLRVDPSAFVPVEPAQPPERRAQAECQRVEAEHQHERQQGAAGQRRCLARHRRIGGRGVRSSPPTVAGERVDAHGGLRRSGRQGVRATAVVTAAGRARARCRSPSSSRRGPGCRPTPPARTGGPCRARTRRRRCAAAGGTSPSTALRASWRWR